MVSGTTFVSPERGGSFSKHHHFIGASVDTFLPKTGLSPIVLRYRWFTDSYRRMNRRQIEAGVQRIAGILVGAMRLTSACRCHRLRYSGKRNSVSSSGNSSRRRSAVRSLKLVSASLLTDGGLDDC